MRKRILIAVALVVVIAGAYGYYRYTKKDPAPTITTAKVTRGDIADTVGATGTLQAVTTVQVGTQVSGTIQNLYADFNSLVRKGQVLARLDPSLFQTQIEQARANLIRAQADLERLRVTLADAQTKLRRAQELANQKLISQVDLEAAQVAVQSSEAQLKSQQAAVTQAQASLQQNEVNLQHTVITAPIDGLVIARNVDVGQTVAASMSAPTLYLLAADLTKMQVIASLDESDVGRIRPGQAVHFRVDAYPNEDFTGTVTQLRLQPQTVQNVVTYSTVIDVPNPDLKLKPGMTANVNIEIARRQNVLRVPNAALRFRPTNEIFQALGQTPPAPQGRRGGPAPDTRNAQPAQPAPTAAPSAAAPSRGSQPPANTSANAQTSQPRRERPSANAGEMNTGGRGGGFGGGDGSGGGRGGGDFQQRMRDRLASLSPEERQQMMERMKARGFTFTADGQPIRPNAQNDAAGSAAPTAPQRRGGAAQTQQTAPQAKTQTATTIDALFGPLPATETFGQVWLNEGGKLSRVRLRLGISDGQQTELIQVLDNAKVAEGTDVVTAVTTAAQRTATAGANAFPGLGNQRGGFPGGGFGGGGFGGNRGGAGGRGGR